MNCECADSAHQRSKPPRTARRFTTWLVGKKEVSSLPVRKSRCRRCSRSIYVPDLDSPKRWAEPEGTRWRVNFSLFHPVGLCTMGGKFSNVIKLPMEQQICDTCTLAAPQLCLALASSAAAERPVRPQAHPPYDSSPRPSHRVLRVLIMV